MTLATRRLDILASLRCGSGSAVNGLTLAEPAGRRSNVFRNWYRISYSLMAIRGDAYLNATSRTDPRRTEPVREWTSHTRRFLRRSNTRAVRWTILQGGRKQDFSNRSEPRSIQLGKRSIFFPRYRDGFLSPTLSKWLTTSHTVSVIWRTESIKLF